ncbi:uncharacterized protein LOC143025504 isoform X2 [Oratosquilla oratoria]|uniref:uncharacterized protein LOC143025504 isoform X2 n=1 Tax=Oratosquilla oratoria TaxID=337810 RepID=UPI003F75C3AB
MSAEEAAEEYRSSLADLTTNLKPLITMLTILADENKVHAPVIVRVIEQHLEQAPTNHKLPVLYLIDSIVKNVGGDYVRLFGQNLVHTFKGVFEKVDERTRKKLYELRLTWSEVFPKSRLYYLDVKTQVLDPAWPITAPQPTSNIHINPTKIRTKKSAPPTPSTSASSSTAVPPNLDEMEFLRRHQQLLELEKKKVALQLLQLEKLDTKSEIKPEVKPDVKQETKARPTATTTTTTTTTATTISTPTSSTSSPSSFLDPSVSSERRAAFLSSYKIEKKKKPKPSQGNIHVDPRRVPQVLPKVIGNTSSRDPRIAGAVSSAPSLLPPPPSTLPPHHVAPVPSSPKVVLEGTPASVKSQDVIKEEEDEESLAAAVRSSSRERAKADSKEVSEKEKNEKEKVKDMKRIKKESKEKEILSLSKAKDAKKDIGSNISGSHISSLRSSKSSHREKEKNKIKEKEKARREKEKKEREEKKKEKYSSSSSSLLKKPSPNSKMYDPLLTPLLAAAASTFRNKEKKNREHIRPRDSTLDDEKQQQQQQQQQPQQPPPHQPPLQPPPHQPPLQPPPHQPPLQPPPPQQPQGTGILPLPTAPVVVTTAVLATTSTVTSGSSQGKDETDSDDSDHYMGNLPQPSVIPNKRATPPSDNSRILTADVDLRQLGAAATKRPAEANDNVAPVPKKERRVDDLFGTEDVDLRQMAPPPGALPAAFQGPDQDLRNATRNQLPSRDPRNNSQGGAPEAPPTDPRLETVANNGDIPAGIGSPMVLMEVRGNKGNYNSPNAASWANFRKMNPEFEAYQRQASTSDNERNMEMEEEENRSMYEGVPRNYRGRGQEFYGRGRGRGFFPFGTRHYGDGRRRLYDDDEGSGSPIHTEGSKKYQVILEQAEDQMKRGEISSSQYKDMLEKMMHKAEQEKIKEVRAKERHALHPDARSVPKEGLMGPSVDPRQGRDPRGMMKRRGRGMPLQGPPPDIGSGRGGPGAMPPGGPTPANAEMESWNENAKWNRSRGKFSGRPPPMRGGRGRLRGSLMMGSDQGMGRNWEERWEDEWTGEPDLPFVTEEKLRSVSRESETKTIDIDGVPREIRTYGEKAIILMDWDDPRILTFKEGSCNIVFDDGEFVLPICVGDDYKEFTFNGETHRVKLGVPTKELFLNGQGYQVFFNGKPISVYLSGKMCRVRLDGKPPTVNIGEVKNTEYLAGRITLCVHAQKFVSLYLDAKSQRFNVDGKPFIIKFVDALKAVTINGVRFRVEYDGLPISISVRGHRRFLRFTALPQGIIPGQVLIRGMDGEPPTSLSHPSQEPQDRQSIPLPQVGGLEPAGGLGNGQHQGIPFTLLPVPETHSLLPSQPQPQPQSLPSDPQLSCVPVFDPTKAPPPVIGNVGVSAMVTQDGSYSTSGTGAMPGISSEGGAQPVPPSVTPSIPASFDVNSLLKKLEQHGFIGKKQPTKKEKEEEERKKKEEEEEKRKEEEDKIPIELMFTSENLKRRRQYLIDGLYRGMQCSSCGLRYPPEQTLQYSDHLDWHFRQNHKQRESTKKANTRKFYLTIADWLQYEEIEDIEERVPSMFESEAAEDLMDTSVLHDEEPPSEPDKGEPELSCCPVCRESFTRFFHQETEEWHLRNAVRKEGYNYHPSCHQDLVKGQKEAKNAEKEDTTEKEEDDEVIVEEAPETQPIEEIVVTLPDDDSPMDSQPSVHIKEEPMDVDESSVDVLSTETKVKVKVEVKKEPEEDDEDDLIIKEPVEDDVNCLTLEDDSREEEEENVWVPPAVNVSTTVISSSIDGNTELATPETTRSVSLVPKIKITVAKPLLNNTSDGKATEGEDGNNNLETSRLSLDGEFEEFDPPPFTVDYEVKPGFKGVELTETPMERRGCELSGLCSIM